jgi:hypothetical protein
MNTDTPTLKSPPEFKKIEGELIDSSPLLDQPEALRQRAEEDGYLFIKGLLPRDEVLELRRQFLEILDGYGWIDRNYDLMEGRIDLEAVAKEDPAAMAQTGSGIHRECYAKVQKLELFHSMLHNPALLSLYRTLFQEEVFPHPRNIARLLLPGPTYRPTPQHQDFTHVQGTPSFWTCWYPVGDCPVELGGLAILRGSHKDGVYKIVHAEGAGQKESLICETERQWLGGPIEAGDILTFNSQTVHRGMENKQPGRVRLSCDMRYQHASGEVEKMIFDVSMGVATWDEIYAGWKSDTHKYFWKNYDLNFSDWDDSLVAEHERICK